MNMSINYYLTATHQLADPATMKQVGQSIVLGIQTLEMGVLGWHCGWGYHLFLHDRFQDLVLHDAFAFFSGIRFCRLLPRSPCRWWVCSFPCCGIRRAGHRGHWAYHPEHQRFRPLPLRRRRAAALNLLVCTILLAMVRFTPAGGIEMVNGKRGGRRGAEYLLRRAQSRPAV